jgi:hypothetical protein
LGIPDLTDYKEVIEAIVPGISPNSSFSLYDERSGDFAAGDTYSIQSAIAVTNPSALPEQVYFELTNLDGTPTGIESSITVPGNGQMQKFLNALPGFKNLANPFEGNSGSWRADIGGQLEDF